MCELALTHPTIFRNKACFCNDAGETADTEAYESNGEGSRKIYRALRICALRSAAKSGELL
jgi:hypothetical protein